MCTLWIDGVTLKVQWQIFARRNMSKNGGRRVTFLGHTGNQATTPAVKESGNRGKKGNRAFVPVTPLVLIGSQHPFLCGKLHLSNTCLRWVCWVFFSRSYWSICFQLVFVCVWTLCLPAVPIWWSDLGSIMSPAGVLFTFVALPPTALWVIGDHLQQACPKHTAAAWAMVRP